MMERSFADIAAGMLRSLPEFRRLRFLELGCGDGYMLQSLVDEGVDARGTTYLDKDDDYIRSREYPKGLVVDHGVDLGRPLPYPDAAFDVVYSLEVIEHIEGHRNFISEAARVCKPGGWFVITTPNINRLLSRLHFALSGVHLVKERRLGYTVPLDRMGEFHVRCPEFPTLHWLLWQSGLRIQKLEYEHVHPLSRLLALLSPLLRPFSRMALRRYEQPGADVAEAVEDLSKWMNSRVLLTSERICLLARKSPLAGQVRDADNLREQT